LTVLVLSTLALVAIGLAWARLTGSAEDSRATVAVRGMLAAFATLVVVEEALGVCGVLGPRSTLLALVAVSLGLVGAGAAARGRHREAGGAPELAWTALETGLLLTLAVLFASRLWDGLHRATFLYDTLSYHLHAPVTWLHHGHLEIVPAVFGDPAPAYAPSNVELWFLFLMAPLRSDYLAAAGQLPFAALAAAAIVATVRELRAPRVAGLAAALAFLLVPEIWQQAPTAMVDLGMAAFFLATLPFLVRLGRGARTGDAVAAGLAIGLCAGAKSVGLVFVLPLALLAGMILARARRLWSPAAAAGALAAAATGVFWYARNLAVTGNPLYPVTLEIGQRVIFPGLYGVDLMRAWEYHLPTGEPGALGGVLRDAGVGFLSGGLIGLVRARRPPWIVLVAALLALFWWVVPYQHTRFLFPLYGVVAIAMGQAAGEGAPAVRWTPLAAAIGGSLLEFPTPGRLALLAVLVAGAASAAPVRALLTRLELRGRALLGVGASIGVVLALVVGLRGYRGRDPGYAVGDELDDAWRWFRAHVHGARVAYTGVNLALPLVGADLENDVRYVNVAGGSDELLHDFARRLPSAPVKTAEPAPYRQGASALTWSRNLRALRRDVLFVAALYPIVRRTIAYDADGFPVERAWADAHPETFTLRFASPAARVYTVVAP
jgi:4-amino-4-deoxy-L-arabinose transferase-like glycosyltransferase